jgi:hypothetical protein
MAIQISGTEVISNSRGLNNIASVDATTAASISAAGVGGGGTQDFTATGAIASGDVVGLRSDGTVEVISGTSQTENLGSLTTFNSSNSTFSAAVFDATNNKVVIAITDQSDSYKGKAFVGTISGETISFGSAVQFSTGVYTEFDMAYDPDTGKIIIAYPDGGNLYATAVVGTVSGTSISFGTPTTYASYVSYFPSCCYDTANSKIVVTSSSPATNNGGKAWVGTVSGTSISFGSATSWYSGSSGNPYYHRIVYDPDNEKPVVFFRDTNDSSRGKARVGTVSGTSISFGTAAQFTSGQAQSVNAVYDTANNKFVVLWGEGSSNPYTPKAAVGTVSGTTISFGTATTFDTWNGGVDAGKLTAVYDPSVGKVNVFYAGGVFQYGNGRYVTGTVSGTSITFNTPQNFGTPTTGSNWTYRSGSTYDANAQRVVFTDRDNQNSAYGAARVFRNSGTISNNDTWIGISTEAISSTATGTITVVGGVNEQQTGLTTGSTYYVAADGSLSTTDSGYKVGKAISATKILITEGN